RQSHPQSAGAGARFPAADLLPRAGYGFPRPSAVAAGGGCERGGVGGRLLSGRLPVARLHRRGGGRRAGGGADASTGGRGGAAMISTTVWIILAGAVATYLSRIGGHL